MLLTSGLQHVWFDVFISTDTYTNTDTLHLSQLELDRCLRMSAGPAMLVLLDRLKFAKVCS